MGLVPIGQVYNPAHIPPPKAFFSPPSAAQQEATDRAVAALAAARPELGGLLVDDSIAALQPFAFPKQEIALLTYVRPNTVAYFQDGMLAGSLHARANLPGHFRAPGTVIRIDTDRTRDEVERIGIALEAAQ